MNYIRITKENIDKEHICCAMSSKQSVAKKEWLRQRFDDGLVKLIVARHHIVSFLAFDNHPR